MRLWLFFMVNISQVFENLSISSCNLVWDSGHKLGPAGHRRLVLGGFLQVQSLAGHLPLAQFSWHQESIPPWGRPGRLAPSLQGKYS